MLAHAERKVTFPSESMSLCAGVKILRFLGPVIRQSNKTKCLGYSNGRGSIPEDLQDFINPFFKPFSCACRSVSQIQVNASGAHPRQEDHVCDETARASQKLLHHFLLRSTTSLNTTLSTTFLSNLHVLLLPALPRIPCRWCCIV